MSWGRLFTLRLVCPAAYVSLSELRTQILGYMHEPGSLQSVILESEILRFAQDDKDLEMGLLGWWLFPWVVTQVPVISCRARITISFSSMLL